ncbi:MAG: hypothetical protein ACOC32_02280 [Nanoarchaeota archaeon]
MDILAGRHFNSFIIKVYPIEEGEVKYREITEEGGQLTGFSDKQAEAMARERTLSGNRVAVLKKLVNGTRMEQRLYRNGVEVQSI